MISKELRYLYTSFESPRRLQVQAFRRKPNSSRHIKPSKLNIPISSATRRRATPTYNPSSSGIIQHSSLSSTIPPISSRHHHPGESRVTDSRQGVSQAQNNSNDGCNIV